MEAVAEEGASGISSAAARRRGAAWRRTLTGIAFAAPWLIGFAVFTAIPIIMSLYYSFTDFNIFQPPAWVGWENYATMLQDERFAKAVANTLYLTILGVPLGLGIALAVALVLNLPVRGQPLYRAVVYLPSIVPIVVSVYVWRWLLNAQYGIINEVLSWVGIPGPLWLDDAAWTKPAVLLITLWTIGGTSIIYLSALKNVPRELYEAARLDGAGIVAQFRYVTWPAISPITLFLVVVNVIGFLQIFAQPYLLAQDRLNSSGGGPENSMLTLGMYIFQNAFVNLRMGYASAIAWVMLIVTLLVTAGVLKSSQKWVHYDQ